MEVLYISSSCSKKKYDEMFELTNGKINHSIQTFHSAIIEGLNLNDIYVTSLSGTFISRKKSKKIFFKKDVTIENNNKYIFLPFINFPILKQFIIIIGLIINIIKWSVNTKKADRIIICDASYVSIMPFVVLLKKLFNIKVVAIVADIYDYMSSKVNNKKKNLFIKILSKINEKCFKSYDFFVLLTEQMNQIVNLKNKPYVVMEGIYDSNDSFKSIPIVNSKKKNIVYTGSLNERYGIKTLVNEFMKVKDNNLILEIYGNGDSISFIEEKAKEDIRIIYKGLKSKEEIKLIQKNAFLLINPRSNNEEYTKYSFPSKTMEYMASETPVLMNKLDGVPDVYYDYVYVIEDTISDSIKKILNIPKKELEEKGKKAREFIIKNKNSKTQVKKILDLIFEKKETIKIKKNFLNIYLFLLLFIFIVFSRNTLYTSLFIGIKYSMFITLLLSIPLYIIYLIRLISGHANNKNFLIFCCFFLINCLIIFIKQDFQLINFSYLFVIFTAFIYSQVVDKTIFANNYIKIVLYLCISSLICQYIIMPFLVKTKIYYLLDNTKLYIQNSHGTPFLNFLVSFTIYSPDYIRNFSIFSEPSYFQFYLLFAFIILYFTNIIKNKNPKMIIILITMLSTFSASVFASFIFIGVIIFMDIYKIRYTILEQIKLCYLFVSSIFVLLYFKGGTFGYYIKYAISKFFTPNASLNARLNSFITMIRISFEKPLFGDVSNVVLKNNIINTFPSLMAIYGIIPLLFLCYYFIKLVMSITNKNIFKFICVFIALFISCNMHIFIYVLSFWVIIFFGIMENKNLVK